MSNNLTVSIWPASITFVSSFYAFWLFEHISSGAAKAGGTAPMVMYIVGVLVALFAWGIAAALMELLLRPLLPAVRGTVLALSLVAFLLLHGGVPLLVPLLSAAMAAYAYISNQGKQRDQNDLKNFH